MMIGRRVSLGSLLPNQKNFGCKLASPQLIGGQTAELRVCRSANRDGSNILVRIKYSDDEDKKKSFMLLEEDYILG